MGEPLLPAERAELESVLRRVPSMRMSDLLAAWADLRDVARRIHRIDPTDAALPLVVESLRAVAAEIDRRFEPAEVPRWVDCAKCSGHGCAACFGRGLVTQELELGGEG